MDNLKKNFFEKTEHVGLIYEGQAGFRQSSALFCTHIRPKNTSAYLRGFSCNTGTEPDPGQPKMPNPKLFKNVDLYEFLINLKK